MTGIHWTENEKQILVNLYEKGLPDIYLKLKERINMELEEIKVIHNVP